MSGRGGRGWLTWGLAGHASTSDSLNELVRGPESPEERDKLRPGDSGKGAPQVHRALKGLGAGGPLFWEPSHSWAEDSTVCSSILTKILLAAD